MRESRMLAVPDGLDGMRLDAALARMLGLSRTVVAGLADDGDVTVDGVAVGKSHRLAAGALLHVTLPEPERPLQVEPTPVRDLDVIYHDSDIIVVDKPVGVAAHPSLGWSGPTVLGALDAAGYRISTSGAPERQRRCAGCHVGRCRRARCGRGRAHATRRSGRGRGRRSMRGPGCQRPRRPRGRRR